MAEESIFGSNGENHWFTRDSRPTFYDDCPKCKKPTKARPSNFLDNAIHKDSPSLMFDCDDCGASWDIEDCLQLSCEFSVRLIHYERKVFGH